MNGKDGPDAPPTPTQAAAAVRRGYGSSMGTDS